MLTTPATLCRESSLSSCHRGGTFFPLANWKMHAGWPRCQHPCDAPPCTGGPRPLIPPMHGQPNGPLRTRRLHQVHHARADRRPRSLLVPVLHASSLPAFMPAGLRIRAVVAARLPPDRWPVPILRRGTTVCWRGTTCNARIPAGRVSLLACGAVSMFICFFPKESLTAGRASPRSRFGVSGREP